MAERIGAILRINSFIQNANGKLSLNGKQVDAVALDQTCTFKDNSEIELNDEQITDLFNQTHGKEPASVPKPIRDTQFANFAILLWQELEEAIIANPGFIPEGESRREPFINMVESIIAKRAYDLVVHAAWNISSVDLQRLTMSEVANKVPDISQWNDHQTD